MIVVPAVPVDPLAGGKLRPPLAKQSTPAPLGQIGGVGGGGVHLLPALTKLWHLHLVMQVPQPSRPDVEQLGPLLGQWRRRGGVGHQAHTPIVRQVDHQLGINAMGEGPCQVGGVNTGPHLIPGPLKGPAKIGLVAVLLPMSLLLTEGAGRDLSKDILDGGPGRPPGPGDTIHDPGGR